MQQTTYHSVVVVRPGQSAKPIARVILTTGLLLVCCVALLAYGGQSSTVELNSRNPAVRESDPVEDFANVKQFMGGAVSLKDMPPQCERKVNGGSMCDGGAFECAQCMDGNGFCKPTKGSVHLEKVDGVGKYKDYYFLTVHSSKGNPMVAMLRSTDGYYREWNQIGTIWTDKIHKPKSEGRDGGAVDLFQVTDTKTGDTYLFRFPCVTPDADPVVDSSEVKENEAP